MRLVAIATNEHPGNGSAVAPCYAIFGMRSELGIFSYSFFTLVIDI